MKPEEGLTLAFFDTVAKNDVHTLADNDATSVHISCYG